LGVSLIWMLFKCYITLNLNGIINYSFQKTKNSGVILENPD